jgi:hypothetical protein
LSVAVAAIVVVPPTVPGAGAVIATVGAVVSVAGAVAAGRTSQIARLNRSVVGAESLIDTVVPAIAVGAFCFCTQ